MSVAKPPSVCMVFSADENKVVYSQNDNSPKIYGGLGLPLLLYYVLLLINKNKLSWTDIVTVNKHAENANSDVNALGLVTDEKVSLFTLFCAVTSINAPDAIIAIGGHILDTVGKMKKSTVAELKRIGNKFGLSTDCVKNLTGRNFEQNPQSFNTEELLIVAKELLSFDIQNKLMQNSIVYRGKYLTCDSILSSIKNVTRYLCFGEENNLHAMVLVEEEKSTFYVVVCGAKNSFERDAEVLKSIFFAKKNISNLVMDVDKWIEISQNIVTLCGDTYCGERYTKWRVERNIDDPIQRFGDQGYLFSFDKVKPFLSKDSFNIVNSECVLSPNYEIPQQTGHYLSFVLGAHPEKTISCYKQVNINAVLLANNHMMDFGAVGCRQTKRYFEESGILSVGTGSNIDEAEKPLCLIINGHKVIIFNAYGYFLHRRHHLFQHYSLGDNTGTAFISDVLNDCSILERISKYRKKYPDAFIILSPHWSTDFNENHMQLRPIVQKSIQAGANLVVGHGPHIPIGVEHILKRIVVYSLGNFVFNTTGVDLDASGKSPYGIISQLHFGEERITLQLYPIYVHNLNTFFQPIPVTEEQFSEFLCSFIGEGKFRKKRNSLGFYLEIHLA
ncbi:MAG: CapA family protein [Bacillota bacterium]|nr:CapA family protein [Bacillota bacterium]